MAAIKRTKAERYRDIDYIYDRWIQNTSQSKIANELSEKYYSSKGGISQQQVSLEIKKIQRLVMERNAVKLESQRRLEVEKLNVAEREAWEAWHRSIGTRTVQSMETSSGSGQGDGKSQKKARVEKRETVGEKCFLDVIIECSKQRAKLLGLEAPAEIKHGMIDGQELSVKLGFDPGKLSTQELYELAYKGQD